MHNTLNIRDIIKVENDLESLKSQLVSQSDPRQDSEPTEKELEPAMKSRHNLDL